VAPPTALAAAFVFNNTTTGAITDNACAAPLLRTFDVNSHFTVNDLNVGFNATHNIRGDIQVQLLSPAGTIVKIIRSNGDANTNYDVLLDSASANPLNDGNADTTAAPLYDRTAAPSGSLSVFNGEDAFGTWTLNICDNVSGNTGTFNSARLSFDGTALPAGIFGLVFDDHNANGIRDTGTYAYGATAAPARDEGVSGVTVTAYDNTGAVVGTATTASNGQYYIPTNASGPFRIEFTNLTSVRDKERLTFGYTVGAETKRIAKRSLSHECTRTLLPCR